MSDDTYNGWTNRETWAVGLHLNNDSGLQSEALDVVTTATRGEDDPSLMLSRAEDALRDWVTDLLTASAWPEGEGIPMPQWAHLMREDVGSLWRVNWRELAATFLADAVERDAS